MGIGSDIQEVVALLIVGLAALYLARRMGGGLGWRSWSRGWRSRARRDAGPSNVVVGARLRRGLKRASRAAATRPAGIPPENDPRRSH
ncbi:MAG: hypothetical protein IPK13_08370 [Deltaproteobacteria bacterium]|nr:hypothetical protein [Deltaproteobacteria bacterium]